jgi:hypothetical protein
MNHTAEVQSIIDAALAREDAHTPDQWYVPACMMDDAVRERDRLRAALRSVLLWVETRPLDWTTKNKDAFLTDMIKAWDALSAVPNVAISQPEDRA